MVKQVFLQATQHVFHCNKSKVKTTFYLKVVW